MFLQKIDTLEILSSELSDREIQNFKTKNPDCAVFQSWKSVLKSELQSANKLRIRSGGTCHRRKAEEKDLYIETSATVVDSVISLIEINDKKSGEHCMCCGSMSFEFYADEALLVTLGFHHGKSFRWPGGSWPGDAELSARSSDDISKWVEMKTNVSIH